MNTKFLFFPIAAILSGCWTFNETPYPETNLTVSNTASNLTIQVAGFESVFTEYEAVRGFQTVYTPGWYGRHYYHPGTYQTLESVTYVPQQRSSDTFLQRAQDAFERVGFLLHPINSTYTVEVTFDGPFVDSGDEIKKLCWELFTVFLFDYEAVNWTAKLRIRETKSGRLIFSHDYVQNYQTNVFGLIPIFSIASCSKTDSGATRNWCLAALTDRAVADATSFLFSHK